MTNSLHPAAEPRHLTEVLERSGLVAPVRDVAADSDRITIMSRLIRLRLSYDGAAPDAPRSLILKTAHPERINPDWRNGRQEVAFYRDVASAMPPRLVPHCHEAQWDPTTGDWHLLLEDLTETHTRSSVWPLPPSTDACGHIVTARARSQAAWWNDPRLGVSLGARREGAVLTAHLRFLAKRYAQFVDRFGEHLPSARRALYERTLATAPDLFGGPEALRHLTIVQGDAHVWNCFLPRDGSDDVRLFDWDGWRVDIGVSDLAHMMAVHWYPERRRRLEPLLLDRYHAVLLLHGVSGYDRAALARDYRRAVLWQIMWPLWQALNEIPPVIWWNNLERVLLAAEDLDCAALLA